MSALTDVGAPANPVGAGFSSILRAWAPPQLMAEPRAPWGAPRGVCL